ncbi:Nucleotidylyl transferase [Piedraia hortae CBS 480.64]|uniref:Nucleotidylyl transferase n=1 Tax=Piedraia hortae CBS 480.64 TaxID=1314780 RepID=A0A6A7CAG2_9PEZI|nr:Nucleotidylyl transferase [Piedraia hortae CBS 480.64]
MSDQDENYRLLELRFKDDLQDFQSSSSTFRKLRTIDPSATNEAPETLFILDSSFNPPSVAHHTLALAAIHNCYSENFPKPARLLLLFATMNADKAPEAASFAQRLTMMNLLAEDIIKSTRGRANEYPVMPIDICVTTKPYYTEKSRAIQAEGQEWYSGAPKHIHLMGYDTLTRLFASRYYEGFHPPLSALSPYFQQNHRLQVTLRPSGQFGSVDEQRSFVERIRDGHLEPEGGKREWAKQIDLSPPSSKVGVSSTTIRRAACSGNDETVSELCTPNVAKYVLRERPYE